MGGHIKTATLLLYRGANVNQADNDGFTPLHYACEKGHARTAQLLIRWNAITLDQEGDRLCNSDGSAVSVAQSESTG
jgi:ankyrin repeat protein